MLPRLLKTRVPLTGGRSEALEPHVVGCGVVASAPARGGQVGDEHVGGAVAAVEPHTAVLPLARLRRLGPCAVMEREHAGAHPVGDDRGRARPLGVESLTASPVEMPGLAASSSMISTARTRPYCAPCASRRRAGCEAARRTSDSRACIRPGPRARRDMGGMSRQSSRPRLGDALRREHDPTRFRRERRAFGIGRKALERQLEAPGRPRERTRCPSS